MGTGPERKLAAIMLADIAGFSALMERDEAGTFERVRALRERLVVPRVAAHAGRIIKTTGDGFLAEFPSATAALQCAIEIQRQNHAQEQSFMPEARIRMRIGINVGDVIIDGDDVAGDGVVIAARLEPLAPLDGICVSATVREHIRQELGVEYHDLGEQHVKNISRPIRAYQIELTGAPSVAPHPAARPRPVRRRMMAGAMGAAVAIALVIAVAFKLAGPSRGADLRMTFAILPFAAPPDDKPAAAFATAVTDAFTTRQTISPWSRVVARESVEGALRKGGSTAEIGRQLAVRYLVRGSVTRAGNDFVTNASIIEAESGRVLGTRDFRWAMDRPVDVYAEGINGTMGYLAARGYIANELVEAKRRNDSERDVRDLAYLASDVWNNDRQSYEAAMGYLNRALALAPDDKLSLYLLARINLCECRSKWATNPEEIEKIGADAVQKYFGLYPPDRQMQLWKAYINDLHGRYEENLVLYDRLLEKSPDDPDIVSDKAYALAKLGRPGEALTLIDKALQSDSSAGNRALAGDINFMLGNNAKAADLSRKAIAEYSKHELTHPMTGSVYLVRAAAESRMGKTSQAKATLAEFRALVPEANSVSSVRKWQDTRAVIAGYEPLYQALKAAGLPD